MTDFAAIDFETANRLRSSICSVGVVIVRGGNICQKIYRLIRPEPEYYDFINVSIHGITGSDTENSPIFPAVWSEISEKIDNLPLVSHNAPFDESCLRAAFATYSMDYPDYRFFCTCRAARAIFKTLPSQERPPNAKLETVSNYFGISLKNHHNALSDAMACAQIASIIL